MVSNWWKSVAGASDVVENAPITAADVLPLHFHSIDLFSGLGGNALAFRDFATPLMYCEILPGARCILKSAMDRGHIPEAPIHNDVRTIMGTLAFQEAKAKRPLMITGSWPCQGNSFRGKMKGMEDPRSGLIRQLCDVLLDAKPEVFFVENTPGTVKTGQLAYLLERVDKLYDVKWNTFTAKQLGFHHERRRFFAVGKLKTSFSVPPCLDLLALPMDLPRLLPPALGPEPPRNRGTRTRYDIARLHALGNAVVPAVSLYAFLTLLELPVDVYELSPQIQLVFDPKTYVAPPGTRTSSLLKKEAILTKPFKKNQWATPRAGNTHACHSLTTRSVGDLPSQVRFERSTPDGDRGFNMSVEWVEHLMGYVPGYTSVTRPDLVADMENAPSEQRFVKPRVRMGNPAARTIHKRPASRSPSPSLGEDENISVPDYNRAREDRALRVAKRAACA